MSRRHLRTLRVLSSAVLLAANLSTLPAAAAQAGVTRTDLQRHDRSPIDLRMISD
ncbi:hypothetical protein [Bradyrhizobium agreste]|uniref:hypothetical protein n=1 Tax=Bradyrhizobium agreste TaxID=2751811 RepID=UPI001FE61F24|nr:hypothetical protein [Bradyrhizobium agreste]